MPSSPASVTPSNTDASTRKKRGLSVIGGISALIAMTGCSAVGTLNAITPSSGFAPVETVAYGSVERQKLDIYRTRAPRENAPVIVFIYGGSWSTGERGLYKFLADAFTTEGYTVVVPDYRLYPEAMYPDFITDSAAAIAWTAEEFEGHPLILMGHSAGAYNMMMTVLAPQYLQAENVNLCRRVVGAVGISGPYGGIPLTEEPYITMFPDRFTGADAVLNNIRGGVPPIMLVSGRDDTTVGYQNSELVANALMERGVDTTLKVYPGLNHTDPIRKLSRYFDGGRAPVKADMLAFMSRVSATPTPECANPSQ